MEVYAAVGVGLKVGLLIAGRLGFDIGTSSLLNYAQHPNPFTLRPWKEFLILVPARP
jgi:hypothetical protein